MGGGLIAFIGKAITSLLVSREGNGISNQEGEMIATFNKCDFISSWRPRRPQIMWGELISPLAFDPPLSTQQGFLTRGVDS